MGPKKPSLRLLLSMWWCVTLVWVAQAQDMDPVPKDGDLKIVTVAYQAFRVGYATGYLQPAWVAYRLSYRQLGGEAERSTKFKREPELKGMDASDGDYRGTGLDRGHLVPAADMAWSQRTMEESFSYANVCPQKPGFNRGVWKRTESQVRDWASALPWSDTLGLLVWAGPVLEQGMQRVGRLSVPHSYFKVVYHPQGQRVAAFLLAHHSSKAALVASMVPVDSIEKVTGLDLMSGLPDHFEENLEKALCKECWDWSNLAQSSANANPRREKGQDSAVLCSGTTKAGKACRKRTKDPSGRCPYHRN